MRFVHSSSLAEESSQSPLRKHPELARFTPTLSLQDINLQS